MLLLELNIRKKKLINKLFPEVKPKFDVDNNEKYKIEVIKDTDIYTKNEKKYL